jgi:biotin carboxyl carrier protein
VQYEVEIGGRIRQVIVHRAGGAFEVSVDGHLWRVDAAHVDTRTMSLVVLPGGQSYDIGFANDPATGLLHVRVGTISVAVVLNRSRRRRHQGLQSDKPHQGRGRRDDSGHAGAGPQRIVAPMPGKIVRVAVKTGDAVLARQTVVVIEAMKMENELKAGRDGIVSELHASEGAPVEAGALLAVIT